MTAMRTAAMLLRCALLAGCLLAAHAHAHADVEMPFPAGRAVLLSPPEGWLAEARSGFLFPTLAFAPAGSKSITLFVSAVSMPGQPQEEMRPDEVHRMVDGMSMASTSASIEKARPIVDFGAGSVRGSFITWTARKPRTGGFTKVTEGFLSVDGALLQFSILSTEDAQADVATSLDMLAAARRK